MDNQTQATTLPQIMAALPPLTEDQRQAARARARQGIIREFDKPSREDYQHDRISVVPASYNRAVMVMLFLAFLGSFLFSAFMVFTAGRDHYLAAMLPEGGSPTGGIGWQSVIVGIAVVFLAEFLTMASVLSMRILFAGQRRWQLTMMIPALAGVAIAITANAVVSQPAGFWEILITIAPPASVVFLSFILEQIALTSIKTRHANEQAYQAALTEYKRQTAHPEQHPGYPQKYANELRSAIRAENSRGRGRADRIALMSGLDRAMWSALVYRELDADHWLLDRAAIPANPTQPAQGQPQRPGNNNGHTTGQMLLIPAQRQPQSNGQGAN